MITFIPNNIEYRIASSRAIQAYKDSQAYDLSQLNKNTTHVFSRTAKEVLLLKYDMWFTWLCKIEYQLRKLGTYDKHTREMVMKSSDIVTFEYTSIMEHNPDIFDVKFTKYWGDQHTLIYELMRTMVTSYEATSSADLFTYVTDVLIKIMKATLHEIYELDIVMYEDTEVFISITDVCVEYMRVFPKKCLLNKRLKNYSKIKGYPITNVVVKNYIEDDITGIIKALEDNGITVEKIV